MELVDFERPYFESIRRILLVNEHNPGFSKTNFCVKFYCTSYISYFVT